MRMDNLILKIQKTKNNNFITLIDFKGKLLMNRSIGKKTTNDLKVTFTRRIVSILKKLRKLKTEYIYLYVKNLSQPLIKHTFHLCKTWNIKICFFNCNVNIPHNGCRYTHQSRKKGKKFKKKISHTHQQPNII